MALRNQLKEGGAVLSYKRYKAEDAKAIADVCLAITNTDAAAFLLAHIQSGAEPSTRVTEYVRHAARYIAEPDMPKLADYIRDQFKSDVNEQLSFFTAIQEGSAQRGVSLAPEMRAWGSELAEDLFSSADSKNQAWWNLAVPGKPVSANPWFLQQRVSSDGNKSTFLCSLPPGGEQLTGILRSRTFEAPPRLKFFLAGHDGFPDRAAQGNNSIRLVDADSGKVLMQAVPPRNDTAQPVDWDLEKSAAKKAYLEIVDADTGSAYAWLAAGRFDPPVVPMPSQSPNQISKQIQAGCGLAKTLQLTRLTPKMSELLAHHAPDNDTQLALANGLVALQPNDQRQALVSVLSDPSAAPGLRERIVQTIAAGPSANILDVLVDAMRSASSRLQLKIAQSLASSGSGADTLLEMIEKRQASARLLLDKTVQDKFTALNSAEVRVRQAKLTRDLEPASESTQKLIEARAAAYDPRKASPVEGAGIFTQNCAICHQIGGAGAVIGPQLDGVGSRGLDRIVEDVLDPNRNVDVNFRTQVIVLKDGDVQNGLFRREEGQLLVLADSTGKEISIPKKDIQTRRESDTSLMPGNFGDIIPEKDFENLMAFLLSKGASTGGK